MILLRLYIIFKERSLSYIDSIEKYTVDLTNNGIFHSFCDCSQLYKGGGRRNSASLALLHCMHEGTGWKRGQKMGQLKPVFLL